MKIELETDNKEGIISTANWSLHNLLEQVFHKEKSIFRAIALL